MKIKVTDINWGDRGREDYGDISDLAKSIEEKGLIHPIVIGDNNLLLAGGRRLTAMISLGWSEVPITLMKDLTPRQQKEVELEENIKRKDLSWQEVIKLQKAIDDFNKETDLTWTVEKTAELVHASPAGVYRDLSLAKATEEFPELLQEKDKKAAMAKARRLKDAKLRSVLVTSIHETRSKLYHDDCLKVLTTLPNESVDLVLLDPPYGCNIHEGGKTTTGNWIDGWHKTFDDTANTALPLLEGILTQVSRILKPGAHCYIFFSLAMELQSASFRSIIEKHLNWQRSPLIWIKNTHSNKDPFLRFAVNYEPFYFCWKGGTPRVLQKTHFASFAYNVNSREKMHPNEKPVELYKELISLSTLKGETILDPTAGSGMSLTAGILEGRKVIGIEKDPDWFNLIKVNVHEAEKEYKGEK